MCNLLARCPKRLEIGDSRFESPMCNLLAQSKGQCSISSDLLGHRNFVYYTYMITVSNLNLKYWPVYLSYNDLFALINDSIL